MSQSSIATQRSAGSRKKRARPMFSTTKTNASNSRGRFSALPRSMGRFRTGFPAQLVMTHKYSESFSLTSTGGVPSRYNFSANGLYDPNLVIGGHQPMYFDQMAALYNHYIVTRSRVKFSIVPNTATDVPIITVGLLNDDTTTIPADTITVSENAQSTPLVVTGHAVSEPRVLYMYYDANKVFGPSALSQTDLKGTSSANPQEGYFFTLMMQSLDGVSNSICRYTAEIEYTATWKELKDIAGS